MTAYRLRARSLPREYDKPKVKGLRCYVSCGPVTVFDAETMQIKYVIPEDEVTKQNRAFLDYYFEVSTKGLKAKNKAERKLKCAIRATDISR